MLSLKVQSAFKSGQQTYRRFLNIVIHPLKDKAVYNVQRKIPLELCNTKPFSCKPTCKIAQQHFYKQGEFDYSRWSNCTETVRCQKTTFNHIDFPTNPHSVHSESLSAVKSEKNFFVLISSSVSSVGGFSSIGGLLLDTCFMDFRLRSMCFCESFFSESFF